MEHKPVVDLETVADVTVAKRILTRHERLIRWAEALERSPGRVLKPLHGIEFMSSELRRDARTDYSPLTVAYEDPVLRAEGLASDRLGDAMDFFELSEREAHAALCSCHLGSSFEAGAAAKRVRGLADRAASGLRAVLSRLLG